MRNLRINCHLFIDNEKTNIFWRTDQKRCEKKILLVLPIICPDNSRLRTSGWYSHDWVLTGCRSPPWSPPTPLQSRECKSWRPRTRRDWPFVWPCGLSRRPRRRVLLQCPKCLRGWHRTWCWRRGAASSSCYRSTRCSKLSSSCWRKTWWSTIVLIWTKCITRLIFLFFTSQDNNSTFLRFLEAECLLSLHCTQFRWTNFFDISITFYFLVVDVVLAGTQLQHFQRTEILANFFPGFFQSVNWQRKFSWKIEEGKNIALGFWLNDFNKQKKTLEFLKWLTTNKFSLFAAATKSFLNRRLAKIKKYWNNWTFDN